jgi:DNA-binding PadR family transcriptional regulator
VILGLLRLRPMHGYELMGELERLFGPGYRPSAGTIYPAVESLEAEKLIEGRDQHTRRVYRLTRAGRSALEQRASTLAAVEVRTGVRLSPVDGTEAVLARFTSRARAAAGDIDPDVFSRLLDDWADQLERHARKERP